MLDCFKLTCLPAGQAMHCCGGNMRQQDEGTYLSYVIYVEKCTALVIDLCVLRSALPMVIDLCVPHFGVVFIVSSVFQTIPECR